MSALPDLQRRFQQALLAPDSVEADSLPIRSNGLSPARRLQVYRHNVISGLSGALEDVFRVTARLVGEGFFAYCADRYIEDHPSTSGDLHRFGDRFASFLREFEAVQTLPYLPDVARLEWCYHEAFHAADAGPLDVGSLAGVSPDDYGRLHFDLHPSVRLLGSAFPILAIWRVNQEGYPGEPEVDLGSGGGQWMVRRIGGEVGIRPLPDAEFVWLEQLSRGSSLAAASRLALASDSDFDLDAVLRDNVAHAVICGGRLPDPDAVDGDSGIGNETE